LDRILEAEREHFGYLAFAIEDLDITGEPAAHLHGVNDGLDQAVVMHFIGKNSLAGELKTLLRGTDGSNLEVE
jgi:hypothetical protein